MNDFGTFPGGEKATLPQKQVRLLTTLAEMRKKQKDAWLKNVIGQMENLNSSI